MIAALQRIDLRAGKGAGTGPSGRAVRPQTIKGYTAKVNWAELIHRVASTQDEAAFKVLFDHFAPRIKGFLLRTGCTPEDAEEIAQGALVSVWRKAASFDPATSGAAAWIFTIARNLRIDTARRADRYARLERELEHEFTPEPVEPAEAAMSREENTSRVSEALLHLSDEQSTVIRLSFIEERPHSEIAERLGIPLGTVKSRIRLAMNRLRTLLEDVR
jgi:RNA polymerase sigma-70 factor (ECF subfamily)